MENSDIKKDPAEKLTVEIPKAQALENQAPVNPVPAPEGAPADAASSAPPPELPKAETEDRASAPPPSEAPSASTEPKAEKTKQAKSAKPKKIKKAPGFYKKFIKAEKAGILEKKYLKFIEVPADKAFVRACYEKKDDGLYIRTNLDAGEAKRLKILMKDIKKNRKSALNFLPLAAAGIVAAGLVVFFTIFANPLLEKALEMGLEAVFEARVEADRFRVSILKFEISLDGLTIADRDSPMKNLIQFNRMAIRLKPNAVLRGKVYIEEIRADTIRFGTDRTVSGALPDKPPKVKKPAEKMDIPPLVDLKNFDAMALLNQEFDKLKTPKIYEEAMSAFETARDKWLAEADSAKSRVEQLRTQAQPLLDININDYRTLDRETIERIQKNIADIQTLTNTVQESADDISGIVNSARTDFSTASNLVMNAKDYVTEDFNHLKSYVDLSSGAAMGVVEPVIRNLLTDTAETYLGYGARALEILEKVKALQARLPESAPKTKVEKYRGRDVVFPTVTYPRFYLGTLASDVLTPGGWNWGFDLHGVSSDPDLSDTTTTLALALTETGDNLARTAAFKGMADFRSNTDERFNAELSGGGFPMSLNTQLSQIGIGGFSGDTSFNIGLSGMTDGSFTGLGDISLAGASIKNPSNTITEAISEALTEINSLDMGIRYEHLVSSGDNFSVRTNIVDILGAALKKIIDEYKDMAFRELERVLNEKLASYIDGVNISQADMENVVKLIQGDKAAIDGLKNTLDTKRAEFEQKIRGAADQLKAEAEEAANQVKAEAEAQAQQALEDLKQGKMPEAPTVPKVDLPSVPKLPGLRF